VHEQSDAYKAAHRHRDHDRHQRCMGAYGVSSASDTVIGVAMAYAVYKALRIDVVMWDGRSMEREK